MKIKLCILIISCTCCLLGIDAFYITTGVYESPIASLMKRSHFFELNSSFSADDDDNNKKRRRSRSGDKEGESGEKNSNDVKPILSLPPIGESSFGTIPLANGERFDEETGQNHITLNNGKGKEVGQVGSSKFELQYTCKICQERNRHKVSRLAYTKGVVITVCKGCMTKHLIADNLGWSKYWGPGGGFEGKTNIEEYMDEIGKGDEVNRVSKDVFHLEQLYGDGGNDDKGEQITSDDGSAFE